MRAPITQAGNVSFEWLVVTGVLVAVLFIPVNGKESLYASVLGAIRDFYQNGTFPLSLP